MSVLSKLSKIKEIPTLPEILLKVKKLVNSDESDAKMLSQLIIQDQALTTKILKTANSIYYNAVTRRISSVSEAITRIGFNEVLKITLAMSVIDQFIKSKNTIGYKSIWRHSLTAANMALFIAEAISAKKGIKCKEDTQDLFLAGLLHDIGIIILDQFFHEEFDDVIQYALKEEKTFLQSESMILPRETHAMVGGALLEIWKLALPVIVAVRYHHTPNKCPEKFRMIVSIIALAEYILCSGHVGSFEGEFESMDPMVWDITGINPNDISTIYHKAEQETSKTEIMVAIEMDEDISTQNGKNTSSGTDDNDISLFNSI